ncbi:MAG TPA: CBS domain-containing protein [Phycisphaerae bacterium]|nr:CBS domain-containing protein [Phycisphaerae bacterium]
MEASEIMTAQHLWVCGENTDAQETAQLMCDHDIGAVPVLDSAGRLEGMITDRDLACRVLAAGRSFATPVREIMSTPPYFVREDADLKEVEAIMRDHKVRRVPVVDDQDHLKGMISLADLVHYCYSSPEEHGLVGVVEAISTPD